MSGLEAAASRVVTNASAKLIRRTADHRQRQYLRTNTRATVPMRVAQGLLDELTAAETAGLLTYLQSPDLEEIALQVVLGRQLDKDKWETLSVEIREELRHSLRHAAGFRPELLTTAADVLFDSLVIASTRTLEHLRDALDPATLASAGHLTAAAAANGELLARTGTLAEFHKFADQLRAQVVALHAEIRLPHLGVSRSVPYDQLYVRPTLRGEHDTQPPPDLDELALPGRRSVVLGDPGAGKSTLAAKLAHDVAADLVPGAEGRVPFLLVLRNFTASLRTGGHRLAHYLEEVCEAPYNLRPPEDAVDYLLRNGRAVVVLDGLDELVEPELRSRVVQLVEGFAHHYPLVPLLVTARRIGYSDTPLDPRLFSIGIVASLDDNQVADYGRNWFALDPGTPVEERKRIAGSFLAESETVRELRTNPLLLALLCAMYASEHYIPRNLAQVYERCAVMLFDRWDSMRGIAMPVQFQGRLRGAVQHLAWRQFTADEPGKALPRSTIVRILADYLVAKRFDEDEAIATAHEFVDFCTGRAWILTDVGASDVESKFGFTHRTFMEYFAAEHLVRTHHPAERLWAALRPRILAGEWEVVSQIALQLYDRNVDDGADEVLRLALAETPENLDGRAKLNNFTARSLGYVHPGHDVIRSTVEAALNATLETDMADRFHYWVGTRTFAEMEARDGALRTAMYDCSPGNLPIVRRTVVDILSRSIAEGGDMAMMAADNLFRHSGTVDPRRAETWITAKSELIDRHPQAFEDWLNRWSWYRPVRNEVWNVMLNTVVQSGPGKLYLADAFLIGTRRNIVESSMVSPTSPIMDREKIDELCSVLVATDLPWVSDHWWDLEDQTRTMARSIHDKSELQLACLLFLPYLEMHSDHNIDVGPAEAHLLLSQLVGGRAHETQRANTLRVLKLARFPDDVEDFLSAWVRQEFNVLPPRPGDRPR